MRTQILSQSQKTGTAVASAAGPWAPLFCLKLPRVARSRDTRSLQGQEDTAPGGAWLCHLPCGTALITPPPRTWTLSHFFSCVAHISSRSPTVWNFSLISGVWRRLSSVWASYAIWSYFNLLHYCNNVAFFNMKCMNLPQRDLQEVYVQITDWLEHRCCRGIDNLGTFSEGQNGPRI